MPIVPELAIALAKDEPLIAPAFKILSTWAPKPTLRAPSPPREEEIIPDKLLFNVESLPDKILIALIVGRAAASIVPELLTTPPMAPELLSK
jgi:hypothetical protein